MAVKMICGLPGQGKSYFTTKHIILPNLFEKKRKIITNITLNTDYLIHEMECDEELIRIVHSEKGDFSDTFLNVEDYQDPWRNEKGQAPIIVVDEAHFSLNKQRKKSEVIEIEEFFSTHRQYGYDIYLITQDYKRIPSDILSFVDTYYILDKKEEAGPGVYTYTVLNSAKKKVAHKVKRYEKHVFQCYKSHIGSDQEIDEETGNIGVSLIWFTKPFLILYAAILLLAYGFIWGGLTLNPFAFLDFGNTKVELKEDVDLKEVEFVSVDDVGIVKTDNQALSHNPVQELIDASSGVSDFVEIEEEEIKEIKYLDQNHPLDGKLLQIRSWVGNTAFLTVYSKETKEAISSIRSDSLEKMGYAVENYSACAMKLTFENVNFFIDCSEIKKVEENPTEKVLGNVPTI